MSLATLFTGGGNRPPGDAQTSTTQHSHTKECGLAVKGTDARIHITTLMNLENSPLRNQAPKVTDCMISCMGNI